MDRGKFISVEGLDKCGKTTVINMLRSSHPEFKYHSDPSYNTFEGKLRDLVLYSRELNDEAELFAYLLARSIEAEIIKEELEDGYTVVCDRWADSTTVYQGFYRDWYSRVPREVFNWMNRIAVLGTRPSPYEELDKLKEKFASESAIDSGSSIENLGELLKNMDILSSQIERIEKCGGDFLGVVPDITFFINTPPDVCFRRVTTCAENKIDFEMKQGQGSRLKRIYEYYLFLIKNDKLGRFIKIDGDRTKDEVYDEVIDNLILKGVIK